MNSPIEKKISVCLLAYNHVDVIESTFQSILDQTVIGYEMIVSDDCSTDGTWERILQLAAKDTRIKAIQTPYNMGMPGNANFAVAHAVGPYVALLHHDDLYREDLLEKWLETIEQNEDVAFVFNAYGVHESKYVYSEPIPAGRVEGRWLLEKYLFPRWGCAVRGTAMIRHEAWKQVGGMREQFGLLADIDLWMRLSMRWAVGYVPEPIITVRHQRPNYYPDIYTMKERSWHRQRLLVGIHATNHKEYYKLQPFAQWKWWQFRTRLSLETAKWLAYAIVRRKWQMIETCAESTTPYDQVWLRAFRHLVRFAARPVIAKNCS